MLAVKLGRKMNISHLKSTVASDKTFHEMFFLEMSIISNIR